MRDVPASLCVQAGGGELLKAHKMRGHSTKTEYLSLIVLQPTSERAECACASYCSTPTKFVRGEGSP